MWSSSLALALIGSVSPVESPTVCGTNPRNYVVESPDLLRLEVAGLPEEGQPIKGTFQVRIDGTIGLGEHGNVAVAGLTLDQARVAIATRLSARAKENKLYVRVDVAAANSKRYYVIARLVDGREQVHPFPAVGTDTVVDAVLHVEGLAATATRERVWVWNRDGKPREVDWRAITQQGQSGTNYRLNAGDRVYVGGKPSE